MDRQFVALAAAAVLLAGLTGRSAAQAPATEPPRSPANSVAPIPAERPRRESPEASDLRDVDAKPRPAELLQKKLEDLSPEERLRMRKNAERWMQLNPDERRNLRDREDDRREHMKHEADAALKDSGLNLDPDRREIFELRYTQERRKIEQRLHKEMEEKRQQQLPELTNRLKAEFSAQAAPAPSATPAK